jgi:hypothetical protein
MDIPKYKWFRLDDGNNQYDYERYLYKTNIVKNNSTLFLEMWINNNYSDYQFSNLFLNNAFWLHQKENYIKDEFPINKIVANRKGLKTIFEDFKK